MNTTIKHFLWALVCAAVLLGGFGWTAWHFLIAPPAVAAELDPGQRDKATSFIDALDQSRFAEAERMLAPAAREALSGGKLEQVWTALPKQVGARESRSAPRGEKVGDVEVVTFTLQHAMMALDARIHFDADGLIDGFRIVPAMAAAAPAPLVDDERFVESELEVAGLPATLTLPRGDGPYAAVVLVHGSGPHDRDETIGPNKPFRDLAHGLAERGIAVLRYEKRTHARPQDFSGDFTLDQEVVNDAVAALRQVSEHPKVDARRVFVLGHSLGGMAVPRIVAARPGLAGAILMAGNARPLQDLVPEQIRYLAGLDGEIDATEAASLKEVEQQRDVLNAMRNGGPATAPLMLGLAEPYWRDLIGYDPAAMAAGQTVPMLILQGERDYQVTVEGDLAAWRKALAGRDDIEFRSYPALNHLMIAGRGAPNPQEYFKPGSVDPGLLDDIGGWIDAR